MKMERKIKELFTLNIYQKSTCRAENDIGQILGFKKEKQHFLLSRKWTHCQLLNQRTAPSKQKEC